MNTLKIVLLVLIYICISPFKSYASDNAIVVKKDAYTYGSSKVSHFSGEPDQWNHKNILTNLDQFQPLTSVVKSHPLSNRIDWIYLEVENPDSIDIWLNLGTEKAHKIKVFSLTENNEVIDSLLSGLDTGIDYRVNGEYKFWLPLLDDNSSNGKFLIGFYCKVGMHEFLPVLGGKDQLYDESRKGNSYTLIFIGIMFVMFVYNLLLGIILKDRIYLFYCLNLVALFFLVTFTTHYPVISIIIGETETLDYFLLWSWPPLVTLSIFTVHLFDLKKESKRLYNTLILLISVALINAFCLLFFPIHYLAPVFLILILIFYSVCAIIGYIMLRRGHPLAAGYFLSWLIFWIGGVSWIMVVEFSLFYHDICYYASYITISIEAILFSHALGKRYLLISEDHKKTSELLEIKNEELLLMNDSMDSFNYHVSHDLKSALVNAGSLSKMIRKYIVKDDKEKVIQITHKLENVVEKGQDTITGFLSLGKSINTSKQEAERIYVKEKIQEIILSNNLTNIEINFLENDFEFLNMNKTSFESIFLNLLTNSAKYCLKKPKVNISLKKEDNWIIIIYSDNGIGINLDIYETDIFSPFKRINNSLSTEGTGIGLYLVKRLIVDYGGSITPESSIGEGLTFTIYLPVSMNQ